MKKNRQALLWAALGIMNLAFAISERGKLYYVVAGLFFVASLVALWRQSRTQ